MGFRGGRRASTKRQGLQGIKKKGNESRRGDEGKGSGESDFVLRERWEGDEIDIGGKVEQ